MNAPTIIDRDTPLGGTESVAGDEVRTPRLRTDALWMGIALLAALVAALLPLLFASRFYFAGDTQTGAFGQWYHLGQQLLKGVWPVMDPGHWQSGNYVVEGQWGLWNPIVLLIGVFAASATNALVFSTVIKVVALVVAAGGGYLLFRSFAVRPQTAALGALSITVTGFTVYMDAASWVTGLMTWALWPYAWWGMRRVSAGRNPMPLLVAAYLLVTIGYVHATLVLALTFVAVIGEDLLARRWRAAIRTGVAGALIGMVVCTVFLPPLLSASVTNRESIIAGGPAYTTDGSDLLLAALPTGQRAMQVVGHETVQPLSYIAWFLPLLFLLDLGRLRRRARDLVAVWVLLGFCTLFVLGPATVGPLRFPIRVLPYVASLVILLAVVALDTGLVRPTRARVAAALGAILLPTYLSFVRAPHHAAPLVGGFVVVVLLLAVVRWVRKQHEDGVLTPGRQDRLMVAMLVATLAVVLVQHRVDRHSPLTDWGLPARVSAYEHVLTNAPGDAMMVGNPMPGATHKAERTPEHWRGVLFANTWYIGSEDVLNTYTPVGFRAYRVRFCQNFWGTTCSRALKTLFGRPAGSTRTRADLMSISTVVIAHGERNVTPLRAMPAGWHVSRDSATASVWKRDTPLPHAGGVTQVSAGTRVSDVGWNQLTAHFKVDNVPAGGGDVTLSRLPWPGYQVANATLAAPLDNYLLTVHVPASSAGKTVTVHYVPPGWKAGWALWALSLLGGLGWSLAHGIQGIRRRRRERLQASLGHDRQEPAPAPAD